MEMSLPNLNINAIMYVGNLVHAMMHKMVNHPNYFRLNKPLTHSITEKRQAKVVYPGNFFKYGGRSLHDLIVSARVAQQ